MQHSAEIGGKAGNFAVGSTRLSLPEPDAQGFVSVHVGCPFDCISTSIWLSYSLYSYNRDGVAGVAAHSPMAPPAHSEPYTQQPSAGFQAGYAEGLRLAQQQLAQQHLQPMPPQHQPVPPQQQGYQQYWHPHQAPVPGYYNAAPTYNSSIMPASPAMNPSAAWQQHGQQHGQPQQVPNQAATFFRGRGRGRRGGGRS